MVLRIPIPGTPLGDSYNFQNDTIQLAYDIHTFGGNDSVIGGNLSDIIDGGDGDDMLRGAGGDDTVKGGDGNDQLFGDSGNDVLTGGAGSDQMSGGTGNDSLSGQDGNDRLFGNSGNDGMSGGAGNDYLSGGTGRDVMSGNAGADMFDFDSVSESVRGSNRDVITDFVQGSDHIDLSTIDANSGLSGNQSFSFIGDQAFSGAAGQLRYSTFISTDGHGFTVAQADTNGDRVADMEIQLSGNYNLHASDFIL